MFETRIREARKAKKMTQETLASLIGVSRENISRYETGQRIPPSDKLVLIALALETSTDELVMKKEAG